MAKLTGVQTIDMVNGEITKVAYEGAEYAKVENGAIGDIAVVVDYWGDTKNGEYYFVVERFTNGNRTYSRIDLGNHVGYDYSMHYFRKISAQATPTLEAKVDAIDARVTALEKAGKPNDEPLKVGDYAKVVVKENSYNGFHKVGAIVGITKVDGDSSEVPYKAVGLDGKESRWFKAKHIVKATDEEVAKAKADIAEYEQAKAGLEAKLVREKAEAIFTQVGRKPNEYRKGDIVEFTDDCTAIGAVEDVGYAKLGVRTTRGKTGYRAIYKTEAKPIAFVESRLDRN